MILWMGGGEVRYAANRAANNMDGIRYDGAGRYDIPIIRPEKWVPYEFIPFNMAKSCKERVGKGLHFFIDDYQFERVWNCLSRYSELAYSFAACMSPDFSTYADWPLAMQIYNHYRKHYVAAHWQELGIRVYPTISWSDERSYDWCFDGEPVGATVCISSVGCRKRKLSKQLFLKGYDAMMERLQPQTVVCYGGIPDGCKGNIIQLQAFYQSLPRGGVADWEVEEVQA